ncbi:MAG: TIM barrel protein [Methylocystaceae bacterium]|nr:TIM barrel protein [Methylocystaceae bacterium]
MSAQQRIGFMQGRLSPIVDGLIQSFPWDNWRQEISEASSIDLKMMEWTLDQNRLYDNPLMRPQDQQEICTLMRAHDFTIPSLTGDCFMQSPFWKAQGAEQESLKGDFLAISEACASIGITMIVVPLVDNGSVENKAQEDALVTFLQGEMDFFKAKKLKVIFESDFAPAELARFIARLDADVFGVNYDTGNSAALGFDPTEEITAYGERIVNVHIKDRVLGGTTVALGTGNADFDAVFACLSEVGYQGNYILQTARAQDEDHLGILQKFRDMTASWISENGA